MYIFMADFKKQTVRMKTLIKYFAVMVIATGLVHAKGTAQTEGEKVIMDLINEKFDDLNHRLDKIDKRIDDLAWFNRLSDLAYIDKVFITGAPPSVIDNPDAVGANNPVRFYSYVFIPRDIDPGAKYPLLVFPHGGVHGDFDTYYLHIVREMMAQQYIVVAPEYRGSTGYGKKMYELIDYGGLENADVKASRDYMVENYEFVDSKRVGIIGWSHGGMIALMNVFDYPKDYQVAFAGVPVSDLIARMGYSTDDYRKLFSAQYHIGQTPRENIEEYRKRSPAWNAHKLQTPLLIHTNTNDDDVYVVEVEHLIKALKAEGKTFEYEIFKEIPGGHSFDRLDTRIARETRIKIYAFLAKHLNPPRVMRSISDIDKAAYRPLEFMK
jgi:dipeptidyl aminopeptidase/acylaminoacyl peptidase